MAFIPDDIGPRGVSDKEYEAWTDSKVLVVGPETKKAEALRKALEAADIEFMEIGNEQIDVKDGIPDCIIECYLEAMDLREPTIYIEPEYIPYKGPIKGPKGSKGRNRNRWG